MTFYRFVTIDGKGVIVKEFIHCVLKYDLIFYKVDFNVVDLISNTFLKYEFITFLFLVEKLLYTR